MGGPGGEAPRKKKLNIEKNTRGHIKKNPGFEGGVFLDIFPADQL